MKQSLDADVLNRFAAGRGVCIPPGSEILNRRCGEVKRGRDGPPGSGQFDKIQVVGRPVVLGAVRQQDDPLGVQRGDRAGIVRDQD